MAVFLIFSIFIIFAIKPSLTTAFALQKEEQDLKNLNSLYEKKIVEIINLQSQIEKNRGRFYLLGHAIAARPEMNKLIKDLVALGSVSDVKLGISAVDLSKTSTSSLQTLKITYEASGDFDSTLKLIQDIFNQRRLKSINVINITKEKAKESESTASGKLKIALELSAYHL